VLSLIRTTPGVVRITGTLTINGGTADIQLPVTPGAYEVAHWTQVVATVTTVLDGLVQLALSRARDCSRRSRAGTPFGL
jgi:hypothetical protein